MTSHAKVREVFDQFDTDGSGTVSTDELQRLIAACKLDMSPEDVAKMVDEVDADGSGEVEFDEFYASLQKQPLQILPHWAGYFGSPTDDCQDHVHLGTRCAN